MYDRIDPAYCKCLRQIMGWKTTFGRMEDGEDRTNTNEQVIVEINKITSSSRRKTLGSKRPPLQQLSEIINNRTIASLGKAIRANSENPMMEAIMARDMWRHQKWETTW